MRKLAYASQSEIFIKFRQPSRVFVVRGFEKLSGFYCADDGGAGQDFWRMAGFCETRGDFGFDAVDEEAPPYGRAGGDVGFEAVNFYHRIADRCAGVEGQIGIIRELFAGRMIAFAGFAVGAGNDGDDAHAAGLELLGHFDGDEIAAAGGDDQGGVLRGEVEVAENAFGEAADVFEEHGLALAVGADDEVVEAQREFNDRIETGKRSVARPHFLDQNPAVPGAEEVNHPSGKNCFSEPTSGL